jgi:hypothetical protein
MHETSRFRLEQKQIHREYYRYTRTLAIKVTVCVQPTGDCFINVFFTAQLWAECNIEDVLLSSTLNHFVRITSTGAISPNSSTGAMGLSWTPNFSVYVQEHIYCLHHEHRISTLMFKSTSTDENPPSRAKRVSISSLLYQYVEIYIIKDTVCIWSTYFVSYSLYIVIPLYTSGGV